MQIEKEKIDYVPVKKTIRQIAENSGKQQRKRDVPQYFLVPPSCEQNRYDDQCDNRDCDEENVVALERAESRAGVGDVNQTEKVSGYDASIVRANRSQYPLLCQLIQSVERQRKKKDELHVPCLSFRAERTEVEESLTIDFIARINP